MSQFTWHIDAEIMGVVALCAGDAAAMLSGVNPSLFTIRTFRSNKVSAIEKENTQGDIRIGMVIGSALALIVGAGGTFVTGSWWPFAGTVAALIVLDGAYEWALRSAHDNRGSIADQK